MSPTTPSDKEKKPTPQPGVIEHSQEHKGENVDAYGHPMPHTYTAEEVKGKKGDLKPGDLGWIQLNEEGDPAGNATKEPPKGPAARVYVPAPSDPPEMTTPSGAPITEQMNPSLPQPYADEGMTQRNPVPGTTQPPQEDQVQARLKERETAYTKPQDSAKHS